jgi:primosomal protein N' (replication factor Y)
VIVGARSALFLPYKNLGAIIVDEEHENAYKQEENVLYHGRDMAVVRAKIENIPIVLVSATPSLETLVNVQAKKYQWLHLPERHANAAMPDIHVIDLRKEKLGGNSWISPTLHAEIQKNLEMGEQSLLFLNRRGYAPLTLCRTCGHRMQCPQCSAWLVEHRKFNKLTCHHCGFDVPKPKACPKCHAEGSLHACGPGVERVTEEVTKLFLKARIASMTSDTMTSPDAAAEMIEAVASRQVDILVGTQIVAKGHHFPHLTLVGVIDADLGLAGGDLRAGERTYQLLLQVSGRSGREDLRGRAYLQTYMPDHPVIQALKSGNQERFLAAELEARKNLRLPPYTRLAALIISGKKEDQVSKFANAIRQAAPKMDGLTVLGPAPAPMFLLRGNFRQRFLIKAEKNLPIQNIISEWLGRLKAPSTIKVHIDIDPYSFM